MFDADIPSRYIEAHYEPSDRLAVVLINRKTGTIKHEFGSAEFLASPRYQAHLRAANAHGADVYLTVNALNPDARRRTKTDVAAIRHLYLDIDEGGPAALNKLLLDRDIRFGPAPGVGIERVDGQIHVGTVCVGGGRDAPDNAGWREISRQKSCLIVPSTYGAVNDCRRSLSLSEMGFDVAGWEY